ncbi:hypothetical protein Gotri_009763 [Gossypium trilobum]|uniref:Uncharacterized protein n=1 Tax=Gossypium trilobum TaxID=34281 RepID=A0A7J9ENU2_9ROSI|nr:hypothetical protein [Gossypium trilobum]
MARMKLMALALVILMMGNCCLATNRKVIKVEGDGLKHEQISVHGRQLLDDSGSDRASYPSSSINNHHFRPRQDFPGGGTGDGSGRLVYQAKDKSKLIASKIIISRVQLIDDESGKSKPYDPGN